MSKQEQFEQRVRHYGFPPEELLEIADIENRAYVNKRELLVNIALSKLKDKQKLVIIKRYYEGYTQEDLSHKLKLSRRRIRDIEEQALRNLHKNIILNSLIN